MTICAAALCEGKYAVLATDTLVSTTQPNLAFESDYPKALALAPNCMLAQSGSIQAFSKLLESGRPGLFGQAAVALEKTAETVREAYVKARNRKLEEDILYPLGLDLRTFYESNGSLRPELVVPIVQRMEHLDLKLWVLVAGADETGPHLYKVNNPGRMVNLDGLGYHAIGSGEVHALQTFVSRRFSPRETGLPDALGVVYEAKKRSEKAQSVGEATRMFVITAVGTVEVPPKTISVLEDGYASLLRRETSAREKHRLTAPDVGFLRTDG